MVANSPMPSEVILRHLERILASEGFTRSKRLAGFLRWVVDRTLAGETESITERNIGIHVYGRGPDFDPKIDGTVRAEAIRLRHKLREYYELTGEVGRIDVPKGGYVPVFSGFEPDPMPTPSPARSSVAWSWAAKFACVLLALVLIGSRNYHRKQGESLHRAAELANEANRLMRMGDFVAASDRARQAVNLAPNAANAHTVLSKALLNLNHDAEAVVEARTAKNLPANAADAAESNAQLKLAEFDTPAAVDEFSRLAVARPSVDLLISLAKARIRNLQYDDALSALARARKLPDGAAAPEVDRLEALALANLAAAKGGNLQRAFELVHRAKTETSSTAALGRLTLLEGGIQANLGFPAESAASLAASRQLCLSVQDDICVASTYRVEGNLKINSNEYFAALPLYEKGLAVALKWQSRQETGNLLDGINAAIDGLRKTESARANPLLWMPRPPVIR